MERLLEAIKKGGGVSVDFSQFRPKGEPFKGEHLKDALAFINKLSVTVRSKRG